MIYVALLTVLLFYIKLSQDYWTVDGKNSGMQGTMILLIENIVGAIGTEFKVFLPQIIPRILKVFMHDTSERRAVTLKVCFHRLNTLLWGIVCF